MPVYHLNKESFEKLTSQKGKTVLIDFWATWCGPCQMLAPVLEKLAEDHPDLIVGKVDVDENMELAAKFSIDSIPALLLFRDGKLVKRMVGYQTQSALESGLGLQ